MHRTNGGGYGIGVTKRRRRVKGGEVKKRRLRGVGYVRSTDNQKRKLFNSSKGSSGHRRIQLHTFCI